MQNIIDFITFTEQEFLISAMCFLFVWLYTQMDWLLYYIDERLDHFASTTTGFTSYLLRTIQLHFDCQKCVTFWTILILLQNPFLALAFSWLAYMTNKNK